MSEHKTFEEWYPSEPVIMRPALRVMAEMAWHARDAEVATLKAENAEKDKRIADLEVFERKVSAFDEELERGRLREASLSKYKRAIENHLCEYDKADWLGCNLNHGGSHCDVCESDPEDHQHKRLMKLEAENAALREPMECGHPKACWVDPCPRGKMHAHSPQSCAPFCIACAEQAALQSKLDAAEKNNQDWIVRCREFRAKDAAAFEAKLDEVRKLADNEMFT